MALYKQGLSDKEIAEKTGTCRRNICAWRQHRGLPCNTTSPRVVAMREVLSPEERKAMSMFLGILEKAAKTKPEGAKLHIGEFMSAWREIQPHQKEERYA